MTNRRRPGVSSPSARQAIEALADEFEEFDGSLASKDPLGWPGYRSKLQQAAARSKESEAVVAGVIRLDEASAVVAGMDFRFIGGSMGLAAGAQVVRAFAEARRRRLPFVSLIASGGTRIQEGMCALTQMQRIARAQLDAGSDGIPHIAVLRDPTTGGVWAALGSVADVILALEGATVAFAGARLRGQGEAGREFTSAGQHRCGAVDRVVADHEVRDHLALAVELLGPHTRGPTRRADLPLPIAKRNRMSAGGVRSAWEHVQAARDPARPRAGAYLDAYFEARLEISGDRAGGRDQGMLCGFGRRGDRTIAYAAQAGGRNTAAGFRTAKRLLEGAARLRLPVLTLIDTPGAANDAAAERGALGTAIGELFQTIAASPVPITSVVIGEGGSGGALALASPDDLWIVPDGYFAVVGPESAAAILKQDRSAAPELAERMHLTPRQLLRLGVVQGVLGSAPSRPGFRRGR
jgi:acyl-CoA carboxylase subunit beta